MSQAIKIPILGDATSFAKACHKATESADGIGSKLTSLASSGPLALASLATAAGAFALKSANTFAKVGGEVLKLQRFTGATAKSASRLRFAGKQAGLDTEVLTKSLGILSKNVVSTKLDKLGLRLKDLTGHALPLNDELLAIADRFKSMPNGAEKTALAMQLFGKAGAAMIPFLNKGAEGIKELEKQSDKFGNTLTQNDLEAVKKSTASHRLFSAAMDGLQIAIGRHVLPMLTKFTVYLTEHMPGIIKFVNDKLNDLSAWFKEHGPSAIATAKKALEGIGRFFTDTIPSWWEKIDGLWQRFQSGVERIKGFFVDLKQTTIDIFNAIIGAWNALDFKLPSFEGMKVAGHTVIPGWEGSTLGMPDIAPIAGGTPPKVIPTPISGVGAIPSLPIAGLMPAPSSGGLFTGSGGIFGRTASPAVTQHITVNGSLSAFDEEVLKSHMESAARNVHRQMARAL